MMKVSWTRPRHTRGFTLIELLVVISIIALLATIGVVGGQAVIKHARNLEARTAMQGLELAIKSYRTEYLRVPMMDAAPSGDSEVIDTSDETGRALLVVLLGRDPQRNPQGKRLWEPPKSKSSGAGYTADQGLLDAWGRNGYRILLDRDGDHLIANPYQAEGEPAEIDTEVLIYSSGANGIFEEGGALDGRKPDDLKSWRQ